VIVEGAHGSWAQLETDLGTATHEILAVLPNGHNTGRVTDLFSQAKQRGVRLTVYDGRFPPTTRPRTARTELSRPVSRGRSL